jgi:type 1 fimbria pilin
MYKIILRKKTLVLAVAIGLGALYSGQAQAVCVRFTSAVTTVGDASVEISVPAGARPGTSLGSTDGTGGGSVLLMNCSPGISTRTGTITGTPAGWDGVMTTPLNGIGIKLTYTDLGGLEMGDTTERTFPYTSQTSYSGTGNTEIRYNGRIKAEYFLISDTFTGGTLPASGTFAQRFGDNTGDSVHNINYRAGTSFIRRGCAIDIADLTKSVPLNNVDVNVFNGPGSGSNWEPIVLRSQECDLSQFSRVQMSARNTNPNAEDPRLFATTGDGRGVGVEVRVAGTNDRIEPGGRVTFPTVAAGGIYNLEARYTRTTAPLVLGTANSTIIIDVNYL